MGHYIRNAVVAMILSAAPVVISASSQTSALGADGNAVRMFVESFLTRLGDHRFETLDADFTPKAIIVVTRLRDGQWASTYQTAEEWLTALKKNPNPTTFREPLTNVTVTIDSDRLAHLRADFQVVREGHVLSSGVDQFTLVREQSGWKIAMVAYTSMPVR